MTLPLDGEYVINAKLFRTNLGAMRGLELPNQFEFSVDGRRVLLVDLGGEKDHLAHLTNPTVAGDEIDGRLSVRLPLTAGPHVIDRRHGSGARRSRRGSCSRSPAARSTRST